MRTFTTSYAKTGPEVGMKGINALGGVLGRRECQSDNTMPQ
jgi:hypothetical protein